MNQKSYPTVRDAIKLFTLNQKDMVQYKPNYIDLVSKASFTTGFYAGAFAAYVKNVEDKSILEETDHIDREVTNMLSSLKDSMLDFCAKNRNIHSSWFKIDQSKREILIYTVLDGLDFDLENKIFQELYADISVTVGNYYINPMVTVLNGDDITAKIPSDSIQLYSRVE